MLSSTISFITCFCISTLSFAPYFPIFEAKDKNIKGIAIIVGNIVKNIKTGWSIKSILEKKIINNIAPIIDNPIKEKPIILSIIFTNLCLLSVYIKSLPLL